MANHLDLGMRSGRFGVADSLSYFANSWNKCIAPSSFLLLVLVAMPSTSSVLVTVVMPLSGDFIGASYIEKLTTAEVDGLVLVPNGART